MRALLAFLADASGATRDLRQAEAQRGAARRQAAELRVDLLLAEQAREARGERIQALEAQVDRLTAEGYEQASILSQVRTDLELATAEADTYARLAREAARHLRTVLDVTNDQVEAEARAWLEGHTA